MVNFIGKGIVQIVMQTVQPYLLYAHLEREKLGQHFVQYKHKRWKCSALMNLKTTICSLCIPVVPLRAISTWCYAIKDQGTSGPDIVMISHLK